GHRSLSDVETRGVSGGVTDWEITATGNHGRDVRQPSRSSKPSHGRFHQSPRGNLRRSPRPVRHEQS
ncbi:MAG: hypothetical protein ACF8OB_07275, partial [Phycisphaeraceae bacterium JB051]